MGIGTIRNALSTLPPRMALKALYPTFLKDSTMKRSLLVLLATVAVATPVLADQALAQKKNCMACHAVEKKVVGPGYKDVAKKYAGQDATAKLVTKVMKGGSGVWGAIPMPANPQVNQAEAETLVKWILSMK
jgi:cytochrome c